MAFIPYHQHLLVRGFCEKPFTDVEKLNKWFIDLVHKVEMEVVAGPTSVYVNEIGNEGLTGTVTLATSHSSIHIWDSFPESLFQFDIYSCKIFDVNVVLEHLDQMKLIKYDWLVIDRNDGLRLSNFGCT